MNKIKTFTEQHGNKLDDAVNLFGETHKVFATQTHIANHDGALFYIAVVFYREE